VESRRALARGRRPTSRRHRAQKLAGSAGQLFVDPTPAGAGAIGSDAVAKSPPDGYTLLCSSERPDLDHADVQKTPLRPLKDFWRSPDRAAPYRAGDASSFPRRRKRIIAHVAPTRTVPFSSGTGATRTDHELFNLDGGEQARTSPYKGTAPAAHRHL